VELGGAVILVSAFGRGHWLAAALAQEGIKTTLIDVSHKLGVWPIEDVEGPFGFFRTDRISESQMERLNSDDHFYEVANGFSLWLKDGPWEFKGPMTKFEIDHSSLNASVKDLLLSSGKSSKSFETLPFDQSWILHLAHQWSSTTYRPNARSYDSLHETSLTSSYFVRWATRSGLDKSLQWLESKGVEVVKPQDVVDLSFGPGKKITGIELLADKQGLYKCEQVGWFLSSEESYFLNNKVAKYLFPEKALESEWCWVRYRISLQDCFERNSLPSHCLLIEDLYSPWTHENMLVLQRTPLADQFDAWMRIPTVQRFNKEYLTMRSFSMKKQLSERMSLSDPNVLNFPQEYYYTYAQLGAPRFPVFATSQESVRGRESYSNIHLDGPEIWSQYLWENYFENHELLRSRISAWWKEKLLREQKAAKKKEKSL
jgi:hypothetical protein